MYTIYGLKDPDSDRFFYVGKTTDPKGRLRGHIDNAGCAISENKARGEWIRRLQAEGKKPALVQLDSATDEDWQAKEQAWIDKLRSEGHPLTNRRPRRVMSPEAVLRLRTTLGLTQAQVADYLGLGGKSQIAHLESGRTPATGPVLRLLELLEDTGGKILKKTRDWG